jgi:hypothetical protein
MIDARSDPPSPLDALPLRVFLDTNVVQNLLVFGEYIFDNCLSPDTERKLKSLPENLRHDIDALVAFLTPVTRTPVKVVISSLTLEELTDSERTDLMRWGFELFEHSLQNAKDLTALREGSFDQAILSDYLPDVNDRLLLGESKRAQCQVFLSMDYRTILRFAVRLRAEGLNVMSPSEYWKLLKPWWGIVA